MADDSKPSIGSKALRIEQARLARFIETIGKHSKALDLAIDENFGGRLDPVEWRAAFESAEPRDANRTMVVTGDHSAVLNAYVEILKASAGSRLVGLVPHRRPHADQVFEALLVDGCLNKDQVGRLNVSARRCRSSSAARTPGCVGTASSWDRRSSLNRGWPLWPDGLLGAILL